MEKQVAWEMLFPSQKPKVSRYTYQWKTEQMAYLSQRQRDSSLFHVETLGSHGSALLLEYVSTASAVSQEDDKKLDKKPTTPCRLTGVQTCASSSKIQIFPKLPENF